VGAAATGSSGVGDGGQAGKQVGTVGVLEGLGVGEFGPGRLGSGMMPRQARASVRIIGCGSRMVLDVVPALTIRHHVTNKTDSQNAGALAPGLTGVVMRPTCGPGPELALRSGRLEQAPPRWGSSARS
jgi:hypothetical protein